MLADCRGVGVGVGFELSIDPGAARAQAGLVAQLGGQGLEDGGVDAHGEAPAGLVGGGWIGQGAIVAGAAGGAAGVIAHWGVPGGKNVHYHAHFVPVQIYVARGPAPENN